MYYNYKTKMNNEFLTGIAKLDFLAQWEDGNEQYFNRLSETAQLETIIDWFDSVDIYVNVLFNSWDKTWKIQVFADGEPTKEAFNFTTRTSARVIGVLFAESFYKKQKGDF